LAIDQAWLQTFNVMVAAAPGTFSTETALNLSLTLSDGDAVNLSGSTTTQSQVQQINFFYGSWLQLCPPDLYNASGDAAKLPQVFVSYSAYVNLCQSRFCNVDYTSTDTIFSTAVTFLSNLGGLWTSFAAIAAAFWFIGIFCCDLLAPMLDHLAKRILNVVQYHWLFSQTTSALAAFCCSHRIPLWAVDPQQNC